MLGAEGALAHGRGAQPMTHPMPAPPFAAIATEDRP